MWSNDIGFKASVSLLSHAFADADSYMTTAFNGAVSVSDVWAAAYRGHLFLGTVGNDTHLQGSSHDDIMNGGAGNDSISGLTGDDTIVGGAGDDVLAGGAGDDLLVGGTGADTYVWSLGGGHDTILDNGGTGYDTLDLDLTGAGLSVQDLTFTWSGPNLTIGIPGDNGGSVQIDYAKADRGMIEHFSIEGLSDSGDLTGNIYVGVLLQGTSNPDILIGTSGDDNISGFGGGDTIFGLNGNDNMNTGGNGNGYADGGSGNDYLVGGGTYDTLIGGSGDDTLISTADAGITAFGTGKLYGDGGNDLIRASFGPDPTQTTGGWVDAGSGDDLVIIRGVVSHLQGGPGNDGVSFTQAVLAENVFSAASSGFEQVTPIATSGNGTQWVDGDSENNNFDFSGFNQVGNFLSLVINAQAGNDTITGMNQGDTIHGNTGNDVLNGFDGNDNLFGDDGKDTLNGGNGNDMLNGGTGDDIINGGAGADIMWGSGGINTFVFGAATDSLSNFSQLADRIEDFNAFHDKIDLWFTVTAVDHITDPSQATLQPGHVAICSTGTSGTVFLIADGNGVAGFQSDGDMFVLLENVQNLDKFTVSDFI
jgi:Ca2+-binding RTX toxin-like protein